MLLILDQPKKKRGKVRMKALRPSQRIEDGLRRAIERKVIAMRAEVQVIAARSYGLKDKYQALWQSMDKWKKEFEKLGLEQGAKVATDSFEHAKQKFIKDLTDKTKVNISILFDEKKLANTIDTATISAADLIKSIPEQYHGLISRAILTATKQEVLPEGRTLWQEIQHIGGVTKNRAKFIARDQTAKINSAITEFQQQEAGINEYIWSTSKDRRVVGKPGGAYPKPTPQHGNHYKMDGKYCKWDDDTVYSDDGIRWKPRTADMPKGKPGEEICCRCVAIPVLDRSKLNK